MLRKFLIIGLGGSGGKTLRYLKHYLEERFREIGWRQGIPVGWQFLHIDTPAREDAPDLPGRPDLLGPEHYLSLFVEGVDLDTIVKSLGSQGEDFEGWYVNPQQMDIPIALGAGQYRAVGRILGLYRTEAIKKRIQKKRQALMSAGASAQLGELALQLSSLDLAGTSAPPVALVISSLAGGTGAGIVTDVCDILRADGEDWLDKSIGILYSADVFAELSASASAGVHPNTAAATAELLHGYFGDGAFLPPGGGAPQQRSGPRFPYLVGHANTKGVSFGDQTAVYRFMARCLAAVMTDSRLQDDFATYLTANWDVSAGNFPDPSPPEWMLPAPRYLGAFRGLGFAEVDLGVGRLGAYAEQRITRDAAEWLLDGHVVLAGEKPDSIEKGDTEKIVKGLAVLAFTRFLNDCRLNERGPEHNQILDEIGVPVAELRNHLTRVATRIQDAGREEFGKFAKVDSWIDFIVEEVEARRSEVLKKLEDRLRDNCLRWVADSADRIVHVVGEAMADQGARVALQLLEMTLAEMKHVAEELRTERQEEYQLSEYLRGDVSDAIEVRSGKLRPNDERVESALGAGIQTGIVSRYNGEHRLLAARLARDVCAGVLGPLMKALRDALDGLRGGVEAGSIEDWPRHDPSSDQVVPDALKPGVSVMSVIDPQKYGSLFDYLTAESTGIEEAKDARRWVRRTVISGDPDRPKMGWWIIIDARWTPPEWLTVGDVPPGPGAYQAMISCDDLLHRTRSWLDIDGSAWKRFRSLGLRGYLSDGQVSATERRRRGQRFMNCLDKAFEAAEPLVSLDREVLARVHPASDSRVRPNPSPIPVEGLEDIEESVRKFLAARLTTDQQIEEALDQSERRTRVAVYTSLSPFHPMVFDSLTKPVTEAWLNARANRILPSFWKARRSRPLWAGLPIPRPALYAMVRGWFIGQLLGLIHIDLDGASFATGDGDLRFEAMLPVSGSQPHAFLSTMLEALPLAIPAAVQMGGPRKYLAPYALLVEWGSEPGSSNQDLGSFREPSPVLSTWLADGSTPGGGEPKVHGDDRPSRRKAVTDLVKLAIDGYKTQEEIDKANDCSPRNSWLGIAKVIEQELNNIVYCLEAEDRGGLVL